MLAEAELDQWCSLESLEQEIDTRDYKEELRVALENISSLQSQLDSATKRLETEQRKCFVVQDNYKTLSEQYDSLLSLYKKAVPDQFRPGVTIPPFPYRPLPLEKRDGKQTPEFLQTPDSKASEYYADSGSNSNSSSIQSRKSSRKRRLFE